MSEPLVQIPLWVDLTAVFVGAVLGALIGFGDHESEPMAASGVVVLAISTGLGGGFVRDILLARVPRALTDSWFLSMVLVGVVVNNAILIVHQTLNLLNGELEVGAQRLSRKEAIAEAVRSRVRPILMSTLTSVGGMLPLVLMPGSGSELYRGLGAVVVGGLAVSTVFTLLLVPVVLSVVFDVSEYANAYLRSSEHHAEAIQASS